MGKILIINGSPRVQGNCKDAIGIVKETLTDAEIEEFSAYYSHFKPCFGCNFCKKSDMCALDDDATDLINEFDENDAVLIATPIYYSQIPGPLKSLIDRFYVNFNPEKGRGVSAPEEKRKLGIILSFGGMPEEEAVKVGEYVANCFRNTLFREVKIVPCGGNGELGSLLGKQEQAAAVTELAHWLVS